MSKSKPNQIAPVTEAGPEKNHPVADPAIALAEKIKEMVRLAHEQGQLTFEDINEVLTEEFTSPAHLDHVFAKLRELEIEVVDAAEVDRVKTANQEEEEDEGRLDALDDPVR